MYWSNVWFQCELPPPHITCGLIPEQHGARRTKQETDKPKRWKSRRLGEEINEREWESAIEVSGFCWPTLASLCRPLGEAQISIRSASLCAWQQVYRGSFLKAGTAPDKGPALRGIPQPTDLRWETAEMDEWMPLWTGRAGHRGQRGGE